MLDSNSKPFLSFGGLPDRGIGEPILDSQESKPLTDKGMLPAIRNLSNKFLHFPQHIDFTRKKVVKRPQKAGIEEVLNLSFRCQREKASVLVGFVEASVFELPLACSSMRGRLGPEPRA